MANDFFRSIIFVSLLYLAGRDDYVKKIEKSNGDILKTLPINRFHVFNARLMQGRTFDV